MTLTSLRILFRPADRRASIYACLSFVFAVPILGATMGIAQSTSMSLAKSTAANPTFTRAPQPDAFKADKSAGNPRSAREAAALTAIPLSPRANDASTPPASSPQRPSPGVTAGHKQAGFRIYGKWTIDVRNPDGTLAAHRAFENSLVPSGNNLLLFLLAGHVVAGNPTLYVAYDTGGSPCGSPSFGPCSMAATETLDASGSSTSPPSYSLLLDGQLTSTQGGILSQVQSGFVGCHAGAAGTAPFAVTTFNPSACSGLTGPAAGDSYVYQTFPFTQVNIEPVNVSAGQIVQVHVNFSFQTLFED